MKGMRTAIIAGIALFAIAVLSGCGGGAKTHTLTSPWYGDLYGVATEPSNEQTGIETSRADSWIHVFWPNSNYPPPETFTMTLEKEENPGDWGAVHTTLSVADSNPEGGSWWLQPNSDFSPDTWYRIVISVPGLTHSAISYFKTAGTRDGALSALAAGSEPAKGFRPERKGDADGESELTHTIRR